MCVEPLLDGIAEDTVINQPVSAFRHACRSPAVEIGYEQFINQLHMQYNYNCDKGYRMLKELLSPDLGSKSDELY